MAAQRQSAASGWSWTSLSQTLVARNLLKWAMNANFIPFMRSVWTQKLLVMLWVKNGRLMGFASVVGTTNKVSPWSRVSWLMAMSACCWVRSIPVIDQGRLEKAQICLGLYCGCRSQCSQLGHCKKKGRKIFLGSLILPSLVAWGQKELAESANFLISLKKMISTNMLRERFLAFPKQRRQET